jgi:undecaprenyl diphosphate synthase
MTIIGSQNRDQSLSETCEEHTLSINNLPKHVSIIMDGNGRWAKERNQPRRKGHQAGAEVLRRVIRLCLEFGVHYLSVYTFSTENWNRPKDEVQFLMTLLKRLIANEKKSMQEQGVRFRRCGFRDRVPKDVLKVLDDVEQDTQHNTALQLNLMFNYGARQELLNVCRTIVDDHKTSDVISEDDVSRALFTHDSPDPDVLIRTGGDFRISNYMLWQLSYTELFFLDVKWPDFDKAHFVSVIQEFQQRHRRYGGL